MFREQNHSLKKVSANPKLNFDHILCHYPHNLCNFSCTGYELVCCNIQSIIENSLYTIWFSEYYFCCMLPALPAIIMTLKSILMSFCSHNQSLKKSKLLEPFCCHFQITGFKIFWTGFGAQTGAKVQNFQIPKAVVGIRKFCTLPQIKAAFAFFRLLTVKKNVVGWLKYL